MTVTAAILWTVALFCLAHGLFDLHQRRYGWGIAGLLCAAALLLTPIPTHAVKLDLPRATG